MSADGDCSACGAHASKLRRAMCQPCYRRALRLERGLPVKAQSTEEQLAPYFIEGAPNECWLWTGLTGKDGYGKVTIRRRICRAHRVIYELRVGPIPEGLVIDHLCRVRNCVNPAHMEPVTMRENTLRGMAPSAVTWRTGICGRGHRLTPENTYVRPDGTGRWCRECERIRVSARRARRAMAS